MARRCFYSFHFKPDCWRAGTVRSIGAIEGNEPASDNDWEAITSGADKDAKIERWIARQMYDKTCTIVLVGAKTANRKWINYEIVKSLDAKMGVVGIRIHGLKNSQGLTAVRGANPFEYVTHSPTRTMLSTIVKCYDPGGATSQDRYDWICKHLANAVEEAIQFEAGMPSGNLLAHSHSSGQISPNCRRTLDPACTPTPLHSLAKFERWDLIAQAIQVGDLSFELALPTVARVTD